MEPTFFTGPEEFRRWLAAHHATAAELLVGYYKVGSGKVSMTWPESVDEALCFGWIDGIRRRVDRESYSIRFTPRKAGSTWSAVNLQRVEELRAEGRMQPSGLAAFEARSAAKSRTYAYEQKDPKLDAAAQEEFRRHGEAWAFFSSQAPWYRRAASWWVVSAKRPATRDRRLRQLIDDSAHGRTPKHLTRSKA